MVKMIMHGCNGAMGRTITGLAKEMDGIEIVAGIDVNPVVLSDYPVFASLEECNTEADVIVDFASAKAVDHLLDYCGAHKMPLVLCTTGLSPEQIEKVKETSKKTAILRSANMSLGINTLMKLVQDAAKVLATRFWRNITTRSWMRRAALHWPWLILSTRLWMNAIITNMTEAQSVYAVMRTKSAFLPCAAAPLWVTTM